MSWSILAFVCLVPCVDIVGQSGRGVWTESTDRLPCGCVFLAGTALHRTPDVGNKCVGFMIRLVSGDCLCSNAGWVELVMWFPCRTPARRVRVSVQLLLRFCVPSVLAFLRNVSAAITYFQCCVYLLSILLQDP